MNNTTFTNKEVLSIIIPAFNINDGENVIVESTSFCNETLVEFSDDEIILIDDILDDNDIIEVNFHQVLLECGDPECCGYTKYEYTMLINRITLMILLGKIEIVE